MMTSIQGRSAARSEERAPMATHPSFTRALRAVRDGEAGLLRAVMIDVVQAGPYTTDHDPRSLLAEPVTLLTQLTGRTTMTIAAASVTATHSTFLAQTAREIVLSSHVSHLVAPVSEVLLAHLRIVGSHGHIDVDLRGPALAVRTPGATRPHPYGVGTADLGAEQPGSGSGSGSETSRICDAIVESANTRAAVVVPNES